METRKRREMEVASRWNLRLEKLRQLRLELGYLVNDEIL